MTTNTLPRLSPTSISDLSCPKRFHTLRVLRRWPEKREDNQFVLAHGNTVHAALKDVYSARVDAIRCCTVEGYVEPDVANLRKYARITA